MPRVTTGITVSIAMATMGIITVTGLSSMLQAHLGFVLTLLLRRDGGYYYRNPNGSTYYDNGKGYSQYTPPGGKSSSKSSK